MEHVPSDGAGPRGRSFASLGLSSEEKGQLLLECTEHRDPVERMREALDAGASTEVCDTHGRTPLLWCALLGNAEGARALLLAGANSQQVDEHGWTPLRLATMLGHRECAGVLESVPEELRLAREHPGSLLWAAAGPSSKEEALAALAAAQARGDDLAAPLTEDGRTALHHAAVLGRTALCSALLAAGCSPSTRDGDGRTAVAWAAAAGRLHALQLLLRRSPAEEPHAEALWLACWNGNAKAARMLMLEQAAADPAPLLLGWMALPAKSPDRAAAALAAAKRRGSVAEGGLGALVAGEGEGATRGGRSASSPPLSHRVLVTLCRALEPAELARCCVMNAVHTHPLVTCLEGSKVLERAQREEGAKDAASALRLGDCSAALEALACGLVRTGLSRSSLLGARLCRDGRTSCELAVESRRKAFVSLPEVQQSIDKVWFKGGAVFHATQRHGRAAYLIAGLACLLASPGFLLASWLGSHGGGPALRALQFDLDVLYAPLERYAARELSLLAFLITAQWLRRVDSPSLSSPLHGGVAGGSGGILRLEGVLAVWLVSLWVGELQRLACARMAHMRRRGVIRELWTASTAGWGGVDLVALSFALATAGVRVGAYSTYAKSGGESFGVLADVEQKLRAIAALLLWLRTLHTLSIFSWLGPLIQMIVVMIFNDLLRWAVVQLLILVSFSSALSSLYSGVVPQHDIPGSEEGVVAFGSMGRAMKTLTETIIGSSEPYPARTWELVASSGLGWVILALFSATTYLLCLNLLIALLAHTVDSIRSRSVVEFAWGRAQTVLSARALPLVPPPCNLLHLAAKLVGFALAPLLRFLGLLAPRASIADSQAQREARSGHSRRLQRAVALTATALIGVASVLVGQAGAEAEAEAEQHLQAAWVRPKEQEAHRLFDEAWADVEAEAAAGGSPASRQLAALQRELAGARAEMKEAAAAHAAELRAAHRGGEREAGTAPAEQAAAGLE